MCKNNPEIIIMNRVSANKYSHLENGNSSVIISITDAQTPNNSIKPDHRNKIRAVLFLHFDDVEKSMPNCITEKDAEKIVNYVNNWKDNVDTIIVHCDAGISRSAGVGAAVMLYLTGNDSKIFDNPRYHPNMACYRAVLEQFFEIRTEKMFGDADVIDNELHHSENSSSEESNKER